jgi:NADH:ubiquinone oxidoreductase, NADH-binding (51 kD) subunit
VTAGLNGGPTLINNVETLAAVTTILAHGPQWWQDQGRGDYAGLKYFSVSGDVAQPQVICLPWGSPVTDAIDACGGMADERDLLAFSPGGASTPFLPQQRLTRQWRLKRCVRPAVAWAPGPYLWLAAGAT